MYLCSFIHCQSQDDLFEDETLAERLLALTEMFPESLRNATWTISTSSISCVKGLYQFSRSAMWIIATSAIILAAPPLIENEKSQLDELSRQQQRQVWLQTFWCVIAYIKLLVFYPDRFSWVRMLQCQVLLVCHLPWLHRSLLGKVTTLINNTEKLLVCSICNFIF